MLTSKITLSAKIATSAPIILGQFIRGDILAESSVEIGCRTTTNRTDRIVRKHHMIENGRQHPRIDTTPATPRPIDATAMDGRVLRTIRCLRVSQAVSHMFTDDSFGRSFVPFSPRRLFSLQVSVYVMSNWILCRARRGRLGRGEEGIP